MSLIILTMISTFIILVISNLLQSLSEEEVAMGDQWELDAEDQMGDTVCICGKVVFVYVFVFASAARLSQETSLYFLQPLFNCRCMKKGTS